MATALATLPAHAAEPAGRAPITEPVGARAFIETVFGYERRGGGVGRTSAFLSFFAAPLRARIAGDLRGPDVGTLDFDPFCACQDNGGLAMRLVTLRQSAGGVEATVENRFPAGRETVRYRLVREGRGWRIADIASHDVPSLARLLRAP